MNLYTRRVVGGTNLYRGGVDNVDRELKALKDLYVHLRREGLIPDVIRMIQQRHIDRVRSESAARLDRRIQNLDQRDRAIVQRLRENFERLNFSSATRDYLADLELAAVDNLPAQEAHERALQFTLDLNPGLRGFEEQLHPQIEQPDLMQLLLADQQPEPEGDFQPLLGEQDWENMTEEEFQALLGNPNPNPQG